MVSVLKQDEELPGKSAGGDEGAADLPAAVRRARLDDEQRGRIVAGLREGEFARLDLLHAQLGPVFAQVPQAIDIFDHGIVPGERPRCYIDMLAFVEMERDRHTYRFSVDTRRGRITVAQSEQVAVIVAAVTDYVARRLVERERMMAESRIVVTPSGATEEEETANPAMSPANAPTQPARRFDAGDVVFTGIMGLIGGAALFQGALWLMEWAPVARLLGRF
ncbi:conserved hypothetical protein [Hyphomicrobiales bacterium]|nr:conserved hypothetical protein [Hyphomicrobiales bacterium]CAH1670424.1 conserved hypothetical protein [Hyphomicrobiales bacterium]